MKELVIFGAGGLGKEVLSLVAAINRIQPQWNVKGFYDDNLPVNFDVGGRKVLGSLDDLIGERPENVVIAIGQPLVKAKILQKLAHMTFYFPSLVHPAATLDQPGCIRLGAGTFICAGARLTCDIALGNHVLVNLNTTIGHDVQIGDYVSLMPGVNIAGNVRVGQRTFIGAGSNIINNLNVGEDVIIGAGSVVIRSVPDKLKIAGVPAKPLKA